MIHCLHLFAFNHQIIGEKAYKIEYFFIKKYLRTPILIKTMPCPICHLDHTIDACANSPLNLLNLWEDLQLMVDSFSEANDDMFNEARMYIESYITDEYIRALSISYGHGPPADTREGYIRRILRGLFIQSIQSFVMLPPLTDSQIRITLSAPEPALVEESGNPHMDCDYCCEVESTTGQKECPICYTELNQIDTLGCNHDVCHTCIVTLLDRQMPCPMCRTKIQGITTQQREHFTVYERLLRRPPAQQQSTHSIHTNLYMNSPPINVLSDASMNSIYYNSMPSISNNITNPTISSSHRFVG